MTRRAAFSVVGLVVAALVGVALLAVPGSPLQQKPTLGLDLQGGLEVTLQAVPPRDRKLTKEDLSRSVQIMRNRVDKLGVSEPEIRTQGNDQIAIQLPGVKDPAAAAAIIGKTAQLELFDLEKNLVAPSIDAQDEAADRDTEALRPPRGPAVARHEGLAGVVLRLPHEGEEARARPGADAPRRRSQSGAGSCRTDTSCSRCRRRRSSCTAARTTSCAPASASRRRPATTGTSSATRRPPSRR